MRRLLCATTAAAIVFSQPLHAVTDALDGTLLSSEPCPSNPIKNYEDYVRSVRTDLANEATLARAESIEMPFISEEWLQSSLEGREQVKEHIAYRGFECRGTKYASGGLVIAGLLWKPTDTAGKRLPLLLALRGGNGQFGAMEPWRYWGWHEFLKAGYVVLATQYRGGPGSEGADGFGGAGDMDDVRSLIPLAKSLGYVDTEQLFAHGGSRGGMQLYMLARESLPLRAMAIRAGLTNIRRGIELRPTQRFVLAMMPDYAADTEAALDRRSAAVWASELRTPTIIFHGTADWRLTVRDALDVADALQAANTPFEMHLYEGDTHGINLNRTDMVERTLDFFERRRAANSEAGKKH